ncbi:MAG: DUF1189 domain-containing protein [Firmicutes bacterium]|nr:DUF1189 domain-containing protein [Bacillota bacterium]
MNFFLRVKGSIADFSAYRQFASEPFDKAFAYLVLLVLLLGVPFLIYAAVRLNTGINQFAVTFSQNVPEFILKNGELSVQANMPLIMEKSESFVMVVDTTGRTAESILDDYEKGIFMSRTKFVSKKNPVQKEEVSFSAFKGLVVTKADVERWLPMIKLIGIFVVIFGFIYMLIAKLIGTLIMAIVCLFFSVVQRAGLGYGSALRIAVYALTLPTVLQTLQTAFLPRLPLSWAVYYGVFAVYLWFAVRANKAGTFQTRQVTPV